MTTTSPTPSSRPSDPGSVLGGWRLRAVVASVACGALAYLGFVLWSGWANVAAALAKAGGVGIAAALGLSLVNYGLRFMRWQLYVGAMGHRLPWRPSLQVYVAGFALTTTPGKAGETLRSVFLKAWGMPYTQSLACILGERLSDLLAVVLLSLWGLASYPGARPVGVAGVAAVVVLFAALSSRRLLAALGRRFGGAGRLATVARHGVAVLEAARQCLSPSRLARASALSLVAWAAEGFAFHLVLQRMGFDIPLATAVSIYAVSLLAGAISFIPGGLGSAEAVMLWLLHWSGVGASEAVAATLLIRLATLWFAVVLGAIALAGMGRGLPGGAAARVAAAHLPADPN